MKHVARPHYLLNECVPAMPSSFFQTCFGSAVTVQDVTFSLIDMGLPANRPRQYVLVKFSQATPALVLSAETLANFRFPYSGVHRKRVSSGQ